MSDLISRSAVIDIIHRYSCNTARIEENVLDLPTAYDVDKVVAELEEETECPNCSMYCADAHICGFDEMRKQAIEIVKQGGVSDDVCEWRLCDEEANVYDTSCRNPHILTEWLEELKDYRDKNKMVVHIDIENMDSIKDKIEELSKYAENQYNKAIDDFAEKLSLAFDETIEEHGFYPENLIRQVAEQLKAGGTK